MSVTLENALVIPVELKDKFEQLLLVNGPSQEIPLDQILPFTGERTEVNLLNFWGIAENPKISEIAVLTCPKNLDDIQNMVYHFETESISSEVVGAIALAIGGTVEYYHFDWHGDFAHHRIYEFYEAKDGKDAYYEIEPSHSDIDDICMFLFKKWHEAHLVENLHV